MISHYRILKITKVQETPLVLLKHLPLSRDTVYVFVSVLLLFI